jgi:hypothetical protein
MRTSLTPVVWAFFFFPELKGRSIESMDMLFEQSAFTMLKRAYPTEEDKVRRLDIGDKSLEAGRTESQKDVTVREIERSV